MFLFILVVWLRYYVLQQANPTAKALNSFWSNFWQQVHWPTKYTNLDEQTLNLPFLFFNATYLLLFLNFTAFLHIKWNNLPIRVYPKLPKDKAERAYVYWNRIFLLITNRIEGIQFFLHLFELKFDIKPFFYWKKIKLRKITRYSYEHSQVFGCLLLFKIFFLFSNLLFISTTLRQIHVHKFNGKT